jgi:chemotaxis protein CheY-P-specific phosphatase CheC
VQPTVPVVVADMAGAILDGVIADLMMDADELLAAHTTFTSNGDTVEGAMLVMPRGASLHVLTASLGAE